MIPGIEVRDCEICHAPTKHLKAADDRWVCINLDEHDPLHPKSDTWTLLKRRLEEAERMADLHLAELNALRSELKSSKVENIEEGP